MKTIFDLLSGEAGQTITQGLSAHAGEPTDNTSNLIQMALPVLMQAMKRNTGDSSGAEGLLNALNSKHDGSILNDLDSFFAGGVDQSVMNDGSKILNHVLGDKQQNVQTALAKKSGMDISAVTDILKAAAPLLLGLIGKQTREHNISDTSGLGSLIDSMLGSHSSHSNILEAFLDTDGDGNILDDISGMFDSNSNNKGGLGGLLGNLFNS